MNIFGDLETPESKDPGTGLDEITLKVYQAAFDPSTNSVQLRAEAIPAFSDGSVCEDEVTLFLNGQQLCSVTPNDFGVAAIDCACERQLFQTSENELAARLKGYGKQAVEKFQVSDRSLMIVLTTHRWNSVVKDSINLGHKKSVPNGWGGYKEIDAYGDFARYKGLTIKVKAECTGHEIFNLEGIPLEIHAAGSQGQPALVGATTLDAKGVAVFDLPDRFYDVRPDAPEKNNLVGLSISVHAPGWPGTDSPLNVNSQAELFVT